MKEFDVVIVTEKQYLVNKSDDIYSNNVNLEDSILIKALEKLNLKVYRTNWDNPTFDWSNTKSIIFRAIWDYHNRLVEFTSWLNKIKTKTILINDFETIKWNIDKHYLLDLKTIGCNIVTSTFIKKGSTSSLREIIELNRYSDVVLKPTISAGGRDTIAIKNKKINQYEAQFKSLIQHEDFIMQPFQKNILTRGEITFVLFDGKYQHAILKKAKQGEFRVQDDFGGSVHDYKPTKTEINFAEQALMSTFHNPLYARVDVIWDNNNELAVSELELIEPELWFRNNPESADNLAKAINKKINA